MYFTGMTISGNNGGKKTVPFWKTCKEARIASGLAVYNKTAVGTQKLWDPIIPPKLVIFTIWVLNTPLGHSV